MSEAPTVHRGREVLCTGCRQPVLDIDEERVRLPITRDTALGTSTQVLNFHRETCFARLREAIDNVQEV